MPSQPPSLLGTRASQGWGGKACKARRASVPPPNTAGFRWPHQVWGSGWVSLGVGSLLARSAWPLHPWCYAQSDAGLGAWGLGGRMAWEALALAVVAVLTGGQPFLSELGSCVGNGLLLPWPLAVPVGLSLPGGC